MTTPATPDFRLYPSNVLGLLAALLADELRRPVPGQSPLAPDLVLIPQVAMRRWLQATLAAEYGIAANLEFLTPGEFVARALDANVPGEGDDLDAATLHWRLYAALTDPAVLATVTMGLPAVVAPAVRVRSKPEAPDLPLMKVLSPDEISHLEEFTPAAVLRLASGRPMTLIVAKERAGERDPSGGVPRTKLRAETVLRRLPDVLMER